MSSATLHDIIAKLPEQKDTIEKVGRFLLNECEDDDAYTADQLYDHVGAPSMSVLTRILVEMLRIGFVESFMTVNSPLGGGIGEFHSIRDIPRELPDPIGGGVLRIRPSDVRIYYRRHHSGR